MILVILATTELFSYALFSLQLLQAHASSGSHDLPPKVLNGLLSSSFSPPQSTILAYSTLTNQDAAHLL